MKRAAAVALGMLLASCSFGADKVVVRSAKPGAVAGGTITIAIGKPASIDPANSFEPWGKLVSSLICEPLIQADPITGDPKPALAESWIVSNGGREITLKLRKGVRFHDGRVMTADDVAFSLSRVASEEEGSNVAGLLRPIAGWAEMHGDKEPRTDEETVALRGVRVAGANAVQISLAEPRADFYRVFTHPLASPVPRAAVTRDRAGFESKPVCAGPYMLERTWSAGDASISLVRFPGYYGKNFGYTRGGRGYADRIELRVGAAGDGVDVHTSATAAAGFTLVSGRTPYLEYVALPPHLPPFDRREVRIALSRAIDRDAIAREVYGGGRTPARGFLPRSVGSIHREDACGSAAPLTADVAGAKALLARANVDLRGRDVPVLANPDFRNRALAEAIARQWESAFGMRARVVTMPWNTYLDSAVAQSGMPGPFRMGWEPAYPGPDAVLAPLFASASIGRDNVARFADPRFERILARDARRAATEADLSDTYRRLEDLVCEQMPAIPVVFGGSKHFVRAARVDSASGSFVDAAGALAVRELYVRG